MDQTTRGFLEQVIDTVKGRIPGIVTILFSPERKAELHLQNVEDFSLGVAIGIIQQTFLITFFSTHSRFTNDQENSEASNVIFRRMAEIRKAIFDAG